MMADIKNVPVPKRKPAVPSGWALVNQDTIDFTKEHEAPIPYLYRDTKGFITTGIGFNVDANPKKAYDLKMYWLDEDGRSASLKDIDQAYKKIKAMPYGQPYGAPFYNPKRNKSLSKIYMRDADMEIFVRDKLLQSERELKAKIPRFDSFPYAARRALLDMQYNMGDQKLRPSYIDKKGREKGWSELYKAIDAQNWERAADQSERRDVSNGRNLDIRMLFLDADRETRNER